METVPISCIADSWSSRRHISPSSDARVCQLRKRVARYTFPNPWTLRLSVSIIPSVLRSPMPFIRYAPLCSALFGSSSPPRVLVDRSPLRKPHYNPHVIARHLRFTPSFPPTAKSQDSGSASTPDLVGHSTSPSRNEVLRRVLWLACRPLYGSSLCGFVYWHVPPSLHPLTIPPYPRNLT